MYDQIGVKLIATLQLKFSPLSNLKFRQKFKDSVRHIGNYATEIETTKHVFLALPIPCQ